MLNTKNMSKLRFEVVSAAFGKKAVDVPDSDLRPSEYYGAKVFNREKMFKYLPKEVYNKLIDVIDNDAPLDSSIADSVADGMKRWAIENAPEEKWELSGEPDDPPKRRRNKPQIAVYQVNKPEIQEDDLGIIQPEFGF